MTKTDDETTALKKQVAELQKQLAKLSQQMPKTTPPVAEPPTGRASDRRPQQMRRDFACFNCGYPNHAIRYCPYPPTTAPLMPTNVAEPTQPMRRTDHRVQPIRNRLVPANISVRFKKHRLSALIDTGSEITIASAEFAKKYRWTIHPCELKEVKAANDEVIVIIGKATENLSVGGRTEVFNIYISPDINGLIVGLDWLRRQGRIEWDFNDDRIQLGNGGWLKLHDDVKSRCRRIYAEMDVELPPRQETTVPVRVSHRNRRDLPFISVTESLKIPNLSKVYSGRSVLPARFSNLQICVANTDDRPQVLKKGTRLGNIESADIVGPASPEPILSATPPTFYFVSTDDRFPNARLMQTADSIVVFSNRRESPIMRIVNRRLLAFTSVVIHTDRTHPLSFSRKNGKFP